ncbi:16S rRNA (cytosine(1402)-N(4))-methyltransferase RsmH [bacterium SCSIO 12741]|nr:16S rRNA (cytosine(1402)-N(4))-methyltransferase RsmH [bacterium SCSIO 12741]
MSDYHNPVLLQECLEGLNIEPNGSYVDVTYGGGGHSSAILEKLDQGQLIAFDQDPDSLPNKVDDAKLILVHQNFKYLKNSLRLYRAIPVDGLLADLGVSSHQFNEGSRGFSFRFDGPLDMRMNPGITQSATDILQTYEPGELKQLFRLYGEIKNPTRLVKAILEARENGPIDTTGKLRDLAGSLAPPHKQNQFLAQVFQALRIEVNKELDVLKSLLNQTEEVLKPGGRLVIISYHSLEDRLVKNYMRSGNFEGELTKDLYGNIQRPFEPLNRKVIVPTEEEIELNNRARSARLRIAIKN